MIRLFALLLFLAPAAAAQSPEASLPDWAAPTPYAPPAAASSAPPGGPGGTPGTPGVPQEVPLDGGLGLLALAGAGYAAKKLRDRQTA